MYESGGKGGRFCGRKKSEPKAFSGAASRNLRGIVYCIIGICRRDYLLSESFPAGDGD